MEALWRHQVLNRSILLGATITMRCIAKVSNNLVPHRTLPFLLTMSRTSNIVIPQYPYGKAGVHRGEGILHHCSKISAFNLSTKAGAPIVWDRNPVSRKSCYDPSLQVTLFSS